MYELGRRMSERGILSRPRDIFLLRNAELDDFIADPESFDMQERGAQFAALGDLQDPFIVDGVVPPLSNWGQRETESHSVDVGDELIGFPVALEL